MKNGSDPRCRMCTHNEGTIDHLISGYPTLAPNEYLNKHNRVAQYLHWKICKHYGAQNAENWYEQKLSQKLIMLPSYGITAYKQTEKSKQTSQA